MPSRILQLAMIIGLGFCAALTPTERARADETLRVGEGPSFTGGGFFVANARGYFKKMGLDIEGTKFNDGALAVPEILGGDLDITLMTANASLFSSIAEGAPLVIVPGKLEGRSLFLRGRTGFHAFNGCNHWMARALRAAGLDVNARAAWFGGPLVEDARRHAAPACPAINAT